jgi:chemotaxis family two-component system response regulator Rcp1
MGDAVRQRDILLAENSPADANLVRIALQEYGCQPYRLHVVADGERALAFLRQQGVYAGRPRPDLLLLDLRLPKVGGWQVLKAVRTTPALARIPVVMLSEAIMEDEVQQAIFPPQMYFVKSLLLREYRKLVEQLEQLLDAPPGNKGRTKG